MWEKIEKTPAEKKGRKVISVTRSQKRPGSAYMMLPADMVDGDKVSIYFDGAHRIGLKFSDAGEFTIRRSNERSLTVRITIPARLSHLVPFGRTEVAHEDGPHGLMTISLQASE